MTKQQLVSLLCEEETCHKEKDVTGEYAYSAKPAPTAQKGKQCTCHICSCTNHNMADCRFKGKPKCDMCGRFGHKGEECWKNPANRGKGRISKNKDKGPSASKGKERANVTKNDSESDTESLDRAFTAHISVVDDNEVEFSCYSWIADSGATTHICAQRNTFENYTKLPKKEIKGLGDRPVTAYGQGTITLSSRVNNQIIKVHLTDTLYVPEAHENIISLRHIDSIGGRAICGNGKILIYDQRRRIIAIGTKKHNLYYLDAGTKHVPDQANIAIKIKTKYTWVEWHHRLGHIGISGIQHIHNKNLINGMSIEDSPKELECDACIQAKQTRAPLPKMVSRQDHLPSELTHTDVWGPARVPSVNRYRYYISFVDDASQ